MPDCTCPVMVAVWAILDVKCKLKWPFSHGIFFLIIIFFDRSNDFVKQDPVVLGTRSGNGGFDVLTIYFAG